MHLAPCFYIGVDILENLSMIADLVVIFCLPFLILRMADGMSIQIFMEDDDDELL